MIDELAFQILLIPMDCSDPLVTAYLSSIGEFSFIRVFGSKLVVGFIERRKKGVKQVQNKEPSCNKVFVHTLKAVFLLFGRDQVLEWSERGRNKGELLIYIEIDHVALYDSNEFLYVPGLLLNLLATLLEHEGRNIQTCCLTPCSGCGYENSARAAARFESPSFHLGRIANEEVNILSRGIKRPDRKEQRPPWS